MPPMVEYVGGSPPVPPGRPFRFAVVASQVHSASSWRSLCREVEALGYSSLYLPDSCGQQMGPLAALGAAAAHTDHLRLGMLVANNDFRSPCVFAKELATLDVLSQGRLEWGVGAGWDARDYESGGLTFDSSGVRVGRMVEAVDLIQAIFSGREVNHRGRFYSATGLTGSPAPVQRPGPPLMVGAAERRLLTFAGRRADIVNVNRSFAAVPFGERPPRKSPGAAVADQISWVRAGAGTRLADVEIGMEVNPPVVVTDDPDQALATRAASSGLTADQVASDPRTWVGSVSTIVANLRRHRAQLGVSHWVVYEPDLHRAAPIVAELVAESTD
ncbi:MAG: TIGR03621 family F420-dependent LLM class oxidoreductase [Acidimicrobiia bacterium]|nr:TIGR03621 family F420-dependent LLM class oxidoreductase [Acidimicrobiia bacterium]